MIETILACIVIVLIFTFAVGVLYFINGGFKKKFVDVDDEVSKMFVPKIMKSTLSSEAKRNRYFKRSLKKIKRLVNTNRSCYIFHDDNKRCGQKDREWLRDTLTSSGFDNVYIDKDRDISVHWDKRKMRERYSK